MYLSKLHLDVRRRIFSTHFLEIQTTQLSLVHLLKVNFDSVFLPIFAFMDDPLIEIQIINVLNTHDLIVAF